MAAAAGHGRARNRRDRSKRFGTPRADQLQFFGDESYGAAWRAALERLRATGATIVEIDFSAFLAAARLLYEGPWVAERLAAIGAFAAREPDALHPVIREIVGGAARFSAADAFAAFDTLATLRVEAGRAWDGLDAIVMPTSATTATIGELEADPIGVNSRFGYYTNFVNLLDLSAIAVPAGRCETGRHAGLPFGITFVGRAHDDARLLDLAQAWIEADERGGAGEGGELQADVAGDACATATPAPGASSGVVRVAVVGAHLRGEPLNWQLTQRGGISSPRRRRHPPIGSTRCRRQHPAASPSRASCVCRTAARRSRSALGDAGRRLRQLRRRHCRPARHRHADARGRHSGAGLPVKARHSTARRTSRTSAAGVPTARAPRTAQAHRNERPVARRPACVRPAPETIRRFSCQ